MKNPLRTKRMCFCTRRLVRVCVALGGHAKDREIRIDMTLGGTQSQVPWYRRLRRETDVPT